MYLILVFKFLNKGERGGYEFIVWFNISYVKFIIFFDIYI